MEFYPKVSIVIPVYNGSNYLRHAIDSALAQTYENIEVIIVNDGSNDGGKTEDVAKSYGDKIRYFHKENGGVASALNVGIREMRGEWFAWLSHDDLFSVNRIEEDVRVTQEYRDSKVVFCNIAIIDGQGKLIRQCVYPIQRVTNPREALLLNGVNMCALTIHKTCFKKTGMFNESNKTNQDVEMSLLLSKYYIFYLNDRSITYARDHFDRGTYRLKEQKKEDLFSLSEFINRNLSVGDFFPDINKNDKVGFSYALEWMGDLYLGLNAYEYADSCYRQAFTIRKCFFSKGGIKYIVGARVLNSFVFRLLIRLNSICWSAFNQIKRKVEV